MKLGLETLDYLIFLVYFVIVASYGYWVYKNKGKQTADSKDFFLRYCDFFRQINILNGLQQRSAFRHWALESFTA